jgi:hypothetical protein
MGSNINHSIFIMSEVSAAALRVAITQLGEEEKPRGSNWGHPVQDYLNSVDIHFPASWCMAFVYWCFQQTGIASAIFKTGGVLMQLGKSLKYVIHDKPQPGDVFIIDFGHGLGHTGFVESVSGDGTMINTVEGNTNDTGSREGYEVCRRQRQVSKIKAFLRF